MQRVRIFVRKLGVARHVEVVEKTCERNLGRFWCWNIQRVDAGASGGRVPPDREFNWLGIRQSWQDDTGDCRGCVTPYLQA
jgi:hypothetical protein